MHVACSAAQGSGSLLDGTLLSITSPGAPFLVYAQSTSATTLPSSLVTLSGSSLFNGSAFEAPEALGAELDEAWR